MAESTDEGISDHVPPTAERVIRRGRVLYALASRAMFEVEPDRAIAETYRLNVLEWISRHALDVEIERNERSILHAGIGSLSRQQVIINTWHYESAGVLAWGLGGMNLSSIFENVKQTDVGDFWADALEADENIELREASVIQDFEGLMYNLHWRIVDFQIRHRPYDMRSMLADTPPIPGVPALSFIKDDISAGMCALFEADPDLANKLSSIVRFRRHAASWLCGHAVLFSEVPLDT